MPRFSLFTPTHRPDFLEAAYKTLLKQTNQDWEWVILPNNGGTVPIDIKNDPQVRVAVPVLDQPNVGMLKQIAVSHCEGDILVELDHDDLLEPHALQRIGEAVDRGAGFVYSDFANFREDGTSEVYDKIFGWEHYPFGGYTAHRAFPADASSLAAIFFAPNHVRAWTREAYDKVGGYAPSLAICDDYDLVCRTYLAGVEFAHVPECLYLYRLHSDGSNTYVKKNAEIQTKQQEISNKYIYSMIYEWCRRKGLPKYDLGAKRGTQEGYLSVDLDGANVNCNVMQGLPFKDNSVGVLRAYDFLEHIPHCRDSTCQHEKPFCVVGFMAECYRVLAPGGWLLTCTPSTEGRAAFQDPTHCSFWNSNSFFYYSRAEQAQYLPGGIKSRFQRNRCWNGYPTKWYEDNLMMYVYADLVALKGQRQPGLVEI